MSKVYNVGIQRYRDRKSEFVAKTQFLLAVQLHLKELYIYVFRNTAKFKVTIQEFKSRIIFHG